MRLSASQLELIRTRPQSSRLYLSIFQPTTIFQAQVNDSGIAKGARVIPFDNVSAGSWTAIEANFTALIGSTPGASDIGRIRVRSATSSQLVVGENSNIAWVDDLYITVLRFVDLNPIYPRIIQDPADDEDVIFYKDYDVPYTNQNSVLGTFVNMGSHRVSFLSGSATQIFWSSTGTYNLLGDSLNYQWFFEGGTPSGSTSADPGLITYNQTGDFVTRLVVSGSSGGIDTGYRYVTIYHKPQEGVDVPILSWEVTSWNGSREESGYKASFKVHKNVDVTENAVVIIFSDDWYGGTNLSLGGNYPGAENIKFVGYILKDTIEYDYKHSQVSFDAASLTEVMKTALGFSVSVESVAAPSKWYQLYDMDGRRALYHYLRWHTTALSIADFQFVGQDQKIQFFDADRTSMFDAIDNYMRNTLLGQVVSDRQGKVWMEVEAKAYQNPTGSYTSVMDISKRDWMGEPVVDERLSDDVSFLELGGVAYTGVIGNTFSALIASAPGNAPSFRGKVDTRTGLALTNQSQLNIMAGNVWANDNSRFPRISMDMSENLMNLDIAPQEAVFISIPASDTVRNELIEGLYIPSAMDFKYDSRNGILLPSIEFRNLVNGNVGDAVEIPISPVDAGINTGFSVPGIQIPPLPVLTVPPAFGTSVVTNEIITAYQAAYGSYERNILRGTSIGSFRNVTLFSTSGLAEGAGHIEFQVQLTGLYFCYGQWYNSNSSPNSGAVFLNTNPISVEPRVTFVNGGLASDVMPIVIAHIFNLTFGQTVSLTWSTSGGAENASHISFQIFRISA